VASNSNVQKKIKDDDDISHLVRADDHAKDISDLSTRLKSLEDRLGTSIGLAATLYQTSKEATKFNEIMEESFIYLLKKNEPARNEIKFLIDSTDRDFFRRQLKRWGSWLGSVMLLVIGAVISQSTPWLAHLFAIK
jgi:hypothetical protein